MDELLFVYLYSNSMTEYEVMLLLLQAGIIGKNSKII